MEWKQFRETNYYVNKLGQIKTMNWKNSKQERIMSPALTKDGYLKTVFVINGINKSVLVHRIVAEVFLINIKDKNQVNHINGIKTDNSVENLEWCTPKENTQHAIKNGLFTYYAAGWNKGITTLKGEEIASSKLTAKEVLEIRFKFKPYKYTRKQLAEEYNISEATIKDIILRKSWKHI